jgi:hypothetical protein
MAFTVTVQQTAAKANGMAAYLRVLTGQAASPIGNTFNSQAASNNSFTPQATSSFLIGGFLGGGSSPVAETASPFLYDHVSALIYALFEAVATLASPSLVGLSSGPTSDDGFAVLEIKAASSLSIDAVNSQVLAFAAAETLTSGSISPAAGSLLALAVVSNGGSGTTTLSVSDTSGLGLTWTEQVKASGSSKGYAGIWTAVIPGGTAHTATASLTVTPSFSAGRQRGKYRTGALTVTPSFSAVRARGTYRTAALTVTPSFSAARQRGKYRTGSLTVVPSFSAARTRGHYRTGALEVIPVFAAVRIRGHYRSAALVVTPSFRATAAVRPPARITLWTVTGARQLWSAGTARQLWITGTARN